MLIPKLINPNYLINYKNHQAYFYAKVGLMIFIILKLTKYNSIFNKNGNCNSEVIVPKRFTSII